MDILTQVPSDIVRTLPLSCAWYSLCLERTEALAGPSQAGVPTSVLPANHLLICSLIKLLTSAPGGGICVALASSELQREIISSLFGSNPVYFKWHGYLLLHNKPPPKTQQLKTAICYHSQFCGLTGLTEKF